MKKTLLFAAVAIGLASCANETDIIDVQPAEQIAFKAVTQKLTKSAFEGSYLPPQTTIFVGSYLVDKASGDYDVFFTDAPFTIFDSSVTEDNRLWVSNKNWPLTGDKLDFLAYTCDYNGYEQQVDGEGNPVVDAEGNPVMDQVSSDFLKPVATWSANTAGKYIDGLTLNFAGNPLQGQTDVCYSEVVTAQRDATSHSFSSPSLKFHHALSWIVVNFNKGTNASLADDDYRIRNVKLNGVNLTGDLELSIAADGTITPVWKNLGAPTNPLFPAYVAASSAGLDFGAAASAETKGILVIPSDEKSISFEYQTKSSVDANGQNVYTEWYEYTTDPATTNLDGHEWLAEKKYTYSFMIESNQISFTTTVVPFTNTDVNANIK